MIQIDMEKPDHCLRCPMRGVDDECVLIRGSENIFGWEEQYANCPLQEVEPERKKGKWIEIEHTFFHKCSECSWLNDVDSGYAFCPRCGSYNGGEQE